MFNNVFDDMWEVHKWGGPRNGGNGTCGLNGTRQEEFDCLADTQDLIDGLQVCNVTEIYDCDSEMLVACNVTIQVDGEWYSGDCEELAAEWGITEGDECRPGDVVGDCFDDVKFYVEGLEECSFTETTDCEGSYECYVDAVVDGEWISGDCNDLADYYNIPIFKDDWIGHEFDGDECVREEVESCTDLVSEFVRGVDYCVSYTYKDVCEQSTITCYAVASQNGVPFEGECDALAEEFNIPLVNENKPTETPANPPRKSSGRRGN